MDTQTATKKTLLQSSHTDLTAPQIDHVSNEHLTIQNRVIHEVGKVLCRQSLKTFGLAEKMKLPLWTTFKP